MTTVPFGFTTVTALLVPRLKYTGRLPTFWISRTVSVETVVPGSCTAAVELPTEAPMEASMVMASFQVSYARRSTIPL